MSMDPSMSLNRKSNVRTILRCLFYAARENLRDLGKVNLAAKVPPVAADRAQFRPQAIRDSSAQRAGEQH